jgi:hypothetical protein
VCICHVSVGQHIANRFCSTGAVLLVTVAQELHQDNPVLLISPIGWIERSITWGRIGALLIDTIIAQDMDGSKRTTRVPRCQCRFFLNLIRFFPFVVGRAGGKEITLEFEALQAFRSGESIRCCG